MSSRDERIDAYIAGSADFARPILTHLRAVVHAGCPDAEETLKWRMPTFMYGGKILCGFAGLKKSAKARAEWADFSPSARREYIEWITEAKRPETRAERLKTTVQWVAAGKPRNWKYM